MVPDKLTLSIRIIRVNNFFTVSYSGPMDYDFRAMLSGRPWGQGKNKQAMAFEASHAYGLVNTGAI